MSDFDDRLDALADEPAGITPRSKGKGKTRSVVDRRSGLDTRPTADSNRRTGLERRRGAGIRREEGRRSAEEGEMTAEQFEFIQAIEAYKRVNKKMFPTWTEVLEVIHALGYRQVEQRSIDLGPTPTARAA